MPSGRSRRAGRCGNGSEGIVTVGQKAAPDTDSYGLQITDDRARSLDLPAPEPGGNYYTAAVGADRGRITIIGSATNIRPEILTGRL